MGKQDFVPLDLFFIFADDVEKTGRKGGREVNFEKDGYGNKENLLLYSS